MASIAEIHEVVDLLLDGKVKEAKAVGLSLHQFNEINGAVQLITKHNMANDILIGTLLRFNEAYEYVPDEYKTVKYREMAKPFMGDL